MEALPIYKNFQAQNNQRLSDFPVFLPAFEQEFPGPFTRYGANPRKCQITSIAINWIPHHWLIIKKIITAILNNVLPGISHKIKLLIMTCAIKSTLSNKKLLSPSQYVFCAHKVSVAMPAQIIRAASNLLIMVIDRR